MAASPVRRLLDTLIAQKGTMLVLAVGVSPTISRDGRAVELRMPALDEAGFDACLGDLRRVQPSMTIADEPLDFALVHDGVLMRCCVTVDESDARCLLVRILA